MRWEILNHLISTYGYKSYLEIGVQDADSNFNKINAEYKQAVDPMPRNLVHFRGTSDDYFAQLNPETKFDLIFVDGLHHSDQVLKDVVNSLKHLSEGGTIMVHDCLPENQMQQLRFDNGGAWTGDVWKAVVELKATRNDLKIEVIDHDWGCGIVTRSKDVPTVDLKGEAIEWPLYESRRNEILSVISLETFYAQYA